MHPARARLIHDRPQHPGPVLYWMHRELRARDNWALLHALALAEQRRQPLAVAFCLARRYPLAALPHFAFMLHGLRETASTLASLGIPFLLLRGEPGHAVADYARHAKIGLLVTDADPTRPKRAWLADLLASLACPAIEVDARNIVPARRATDKAEYMARTLRPKIQRLLPEFLDPFPNLTPGLCLDASPGASPGSPPACALTLPPWPAAAPAVDWPALLAEFGPPPPHFPPGETAAHSALAAFLRTGLPRYADDRNTPLEPASSRLSPYLHFGQISAQRIALAVQASPAPLEARLAFLEQLIVRRELAENFCLHTPHYDSTEAFPAWARATLAKHQHDARPFLASESQLDAAATPDPLWNAAQRQLLATGHLHGWLRMYWAKQILLWSPDSETALARVLRLNDTLSLDGRDVNGYAGAAWSIGGVHDRPWPERPVFGTIRSMTPGGAAKKFDVKRFVEAWTRPSLL